VKWVVGFSNVDEVLSALVFGEHLWRREFLVCVHSMLLTLERDGMEDFGKVVVLLLGLIRGGSGWLAGWLVGSGLDEERRRFKMISGWMDEWMAGWFKVSRS